MTTFDKDLNSALDHLCRIEAKYQIRANEGPVEEKVYRTLHDGSDGWLVNERWVRDRAPESCSIPGFSEHWNGLPEPRQWPLAIWMTLKRRNLRFLQLLLGWRYGWRLGERYLCRSQADLIHFSRGAQSLRGFYIISRPGFTIKTAIGKRAESLDCEIEALSRIRDLTLEGIETPEVYNIDPDGPCYFEKIYRGRCISGHPEEKRLSARFLRGLLEMYQESGIEFLSAARVYDMEKLDQLCIILDELVSAGCEDRLHSNACEFRELIGKVIDDAEKGALIPVTVVHGDLHPGNIVVDDNNKLRLIDWELSRRTAIMVDLSYCIFYVEAPIEGVQNGYTALKDSCPPGRSVLLLKSQFILDVLFDKNALWEKQSLTKWLSGPKTFPDFIAKVTLAESFDTTTPD